MSQTPSHILENLQTALPAVANAVKGGWDNIQNLTIKTNSSVSLPIWSCTLSMTDVRQTEDAEEGVEDSEKEEEEEEKAAREQASRKGKKRVTNSDGEIEGVEKPRKRSKVADGKVRGVSTSKKVEKEVEEEEGEEEEVEEEEKAAKETKRVRISGEQIAKKKRKTRATPRRVPGLFQSIR